MEFERIADAIVLNVGISHTNQRSRKSLHSILDTCLSAMLESTGYTSIGNGDFCLSATEHLFIDEMKIFSSPCFSISKNHISFDI
jgi:hypothetical protein